VDAWDRRINSRQVHLQVWECVSVPPGNGEKPAFSNYSGNGLIGAAVRRNGRLSPVGDGTRFKEKDKVYCFVFQNEIQAVGTFLDQMGWRLIDSVDKAYFTTSVCTL